MKSMFRGKMLAWLMVCALVFAGCSESSSGDDGNDNVITGVSISVENDADSIAATGSILLTASASGEGNPSVTYQWEITAGSDYAELSDTKEKTVTLTGKNTTTSDQTVSVKVTASDGANIRTATKNITIEAAEDPTAVTLTNVTISGSSQIAATAETELQANPTFSGENFDASEILYTWSLSGEEYAELSATEGKTVTLTGKNTTTTDQTVTVNVTANDGTNTRTATKIITIEAAEETTMVTLTDITISGSSQIAATAKTELEANPTYTGKNFDASEILYTWSLSGEEYAELSATTGEVVTLTGKNATATDQTVTVNLEAKYGETKKSASKKIIIGAAEKPVESEVTGVTIESDATGNTLSPRGSTILTARPETNGSPELSYQWAIIDGSDYAELSESTSEKITLTAKNTTAQQKSVTVQVQVINADNSEDLQENTIEINIAAEETPKPIMLSTVIVNGTAEMNAGVPANLEAKITYTGDNYDAAKVVYHWSIVAVDDTEATSTSYATLTSDGATATVRGINTGADSEPTEHKITIQVVATYDGDESNTANTSHIITINIAGSTVNDVSITGETAITKANGTTTLSAKAAVTDDNPEVGYEWKIISGEDYAEIVSDGSTATITGTNKTATSQNVIVQVTATHGVNGSNKKKEVTVTVAALTLDSIAVTKKPDKTTYTVGEAFDTTGMEITATYSDGTKEIVPLAGINISGYDLETKLAESEEQTVSVSYGNGFGTEQTTFSITVQPAAVEMVSASIGLSFLNGDTDITVTINKSDKTLTATAPDANDSYQFTWYINKEKQTGDESSATVSTLDISTVSLQKGDEIVVTAKEASTGAIYSAAYTVTD